MVKLNLDVPLEQQGPFDLILHKLSDQLARSPDGRPLTVKHIEAVQKYIAEHPDVQVLDPIENVMWLSDRHQQYQFVHDCDVVDENWRYFIPSFTELTTSDVVENKRLLAESGIDFPIVCKPSVSHCNGHGGIPLQADREEMSIIFNEAGLHDIQPPCVVQAFVNHNARLFKIFIIGRRRFIIQRPSVKNLSAGDHKTVFFNSNDVSKSYSSSHLNTMDESEVDHPIIEPDERKMDHLVTGIQKKFGLELLGIDVIIENGTGRYGVIDINAFPGYDGVEEFFPSLLELIQCKIYGTDIQPVTNETPGTVQQAGDGTHGTETVRAAAAAAKCAELKPSPDANCDFTASLDQSPSDTNWYCFSSGLCSEFVKSSPALFSSLLERPLPDGQAGVEREHAGGSVVNGFTSNH